MNNESILRVGIYLRLSQEDNNKLYKGEKSESIKNQRNMLIQYINKYPMFRLVDEYCDEDLSGAGSYRPEFERLINDCENGKLDIVLCKSQSRFSRDIETCEKYINNKFKEWNVRFIGVCDNADTLVDGNKKSRQINGLVNEWFLEDVSNNIRSAFKAKMKQGEFISPFAAFGYLVDPSNNNKLIVDEAASKIVKDIYNLYLSGMGFGGIAKCLNDKNVPSPSLYKYRNGIKLNIVSNKIPEDIKWSGNAIKNILKNEIYLGHLIQGKRTTVSYKNHKIRKKSKEEWIKTMNTHEAIISNKVFDKVKIAMKERTKSMSKSFSVHNFSGKVFCAECRSYMRKKSNMKYEYLVCSNYENNGKCSNKNSIRYDVLEKVILNKINDRIKKYYNVNILLEIDAKSENVFKSKIESLEKCLDEIKCKASKLKGYFKNIYEDKVNCVITINEFNDLKSCYKREIDDYNKQIESIVKEIDYCKMKEETYKNKEEVFSKYLELIKLNRIIVEEFIDKIYISEIDNVNKCRNIIIKWY